MAILTELNDPRVQDVTVTGVEVAADMRQAKVHVSVRGNDTKQKLSLQGLRSAAGFLQAKLASRIETRYTPRLEFVLDLGVKKSIEMAQILERVLPAKSSAEVAPDESLAPGEPANDELADDQEGDDDSPHQT